MYDFRIIRGSIYLEMVGYNNNNSILYKVLGCKAEIVVFM